MFSLFQFPARVWWVPFLIIIFIISHFLTQQNTSWCYYQSRSRLPRTSSLGRRGLAWTSSLPRAGLAWVAWVASARPRSFSLWSEFDLMGSFSLWFDGFLGFYFFIFFNLDFRWLLGVDLGGCFVLADLWSVFVFCTCWNFISSVRMI